MTEEADLEFRVHQLEERMHNALRYRSGRQPNLRDLRDAALTKVQDGDSVAYNASTGRWDPLAPLAPMAGRAMSTVDLSLAYNVETHVPLQRLQYATGLEWDPLESAFEVPADGGGDYVFFAEAWAMVNLSGGSTYPIRGHASIHVVRNHGLADETVLSDPHSWAESEYRAPVVVTMHASAEAPLVAGDTISVTAINDFICSGAPANPDVYLYANAHIDGSSVQFSASRLRAARPAVAGDFVLAAPGTLSRTNFDGDLGCEFTTGDTPISVTHLARMRVGTGGTRTVSLIRKSDMALMASASTNGAAVAAGEFAWTAITPVALAANTTYYLVSTETNGASAAWWDVFAASYRSEHATLDWAVFRAPGGGAFTRSTARRSFGPCSFRYTI